MRRGCTPVCCGRFLEINGEARRRFVARASELLGGLDGRVIAVWGLAFKEGTDDLRESPALAVIEGLLERGAVVRAHDPAAMENAARRLPPEVRLCADPATAASGADAVLLCTPWPDYRALDLSAVAASMRGDLLLDGRNLLSAAAVRAAGLRYEGIGRGRHRLAAPPARRHAPGKDAPVAAGDDAVLDVDGLLTR
jgi:UDPglucose 6-dehydrogenase